MSSFKNSNKYVFCGRKFHNRIKSYLISLYSSKKHIIDFGPGAGGDIRKFSNANVKSLVGFNIVPIQYNYNSSFMTFHTMKNELYNVTKFTNKQFDVATCFFAIHYFFKNNKTLSNFYNNVNNTLKLGGIFIFTCLNSKKVSSLIKHKNFTSDVFSISKHNNAIKVQLKGTPYFQLSNSIEYLVDLDRLRTVFKNFEIIKEIPFDEFSFKEKFYMGPLEQKFSFLNQAVIMKKIKNS